MLRKNLGGPQDLENMPSFLGRIFRIAMYGVDNFDYLQLVKATDDAKLDAWKKCRNAFGMHATYDFDDTSRQQYQLNF
jgi:hypothetical protein